MTVGVALALGCALFDGYASYRENAEAMRLFEDSQSGPVAIGVATNPSATGNLLWHLPGCRHFSEQFGTVVELSVVGDGGDYNVRPFAEFSALRHLGMNNVRISAADIGLLCARCRLEEISFHGMEIDMRDVTAWQAIRPGLVVTLIE